MADSALLAEEKSVSFSLAGCGFLGIYHIGAAACLSEHVPHLLENAKFCGASAGALIACCLLCKVPMDQCVDFTLRLARSSSQYPLKGWEPSINIDAILRSSVEQVLPENAHSICTDRLFISITRFSDMSNRIISKFRTRKELIDALMCSSYVPGFSSYSIPKFGNEYVLDGGLSDNLPVIDVDTITICPWAGEHSICPQDPTGQTFPLTVMNMSMSPSAYNLARFKDAFFSPKPDTLKDYCWQGYDDALRFLQENHLIHCRTHRVLAVLTNLEQRMCSDCIECEHHRAHARNSQLSTTIIDKWEACTFESAWKISSLILEPLWKCLNIWFIPVTMFRDWILKLFAMAYLQIDKVRKGGLSAELLKFVKKLYHPRQMLWEFLLLSITQVVLRGAEFWARVFSEVVGLTSSVKRTKMALFNEICLKCGHSYNLPAGPIKAKPITQEEGLQEATCTENMAMPEVVVLPTDDREAIPAGAEKRNEVVVMPKTEGPIVTVKRPEKHELLPSQGPDTLAVWVDIQADRVKLDLPLPQEHNEEGVPKPEVPETVHVEGPGDIKGVFINPMMVPTPQLQPEGALAHTSKTNTLHHYVHEFEHLKNVMTLHYVDEDCYQRTEKLFVEDLEEETISEEDLLKGPAEENTWEEIVQPATSQTGQATTRPGQATTQPGQATTQPGQDCEASLEASVRHDLSKELVQLIERQLFLGPTGQRRFQREYEAIHQLRLRRARRREVKADTGRYSLQLIRFGLSGPPPPSPSSDLSNSSSLLSVNEEERVPDRMRSVSDAQTMVHKLHLVRDRLVSHRKAMANESPLCHSHSNLSENYPLSASLEAMNVDYLSQSDLASAAQFTSMQALPQVSRVHAPLVQSISDTSEVAAHLQRLKKWRAQFSDNAPSEMKQAAPEHTSTEHKPSSSGKPQMQKVATAPVLALDDEKVAAFAAQQESGSTIGHAALPTITDEAQQQGLRKGGVEEEGGRLERSHTIRGSGILHTKLLSNLKELRAQALPQSTPTPLTTTLTTPTSETTSTSATTTTTTTTTSTF